MRATGQAAVADRPARREPSAGWSRPGRSSANGSAAPAAAGRTPAASGRHQADPGRGRRARATPSSASAAAGCCPATRVLGRDRRVRRRTRARLAGQPGARPRRHGAERRPDPGDGHREVPAALARPSGRRGRRRSAILDEILAASAARRRPRRSARRPRATSTARSRRSSPGPATATPRRSSPQARATFGDDFWGFWMLGGMSGGGMGFFFAPHRKAEAQERPAGDHERGQAASCEHALPFAMEPVVYDFAINPQRHVRPSCSSGDDALMPRGYYALHRARAGCAQDPRAAARVAARRARPLRRRLPHAARSSPGMVEIALRPPAAAAQATATGAARSLDELLAAQRLRPRAARADPRRPAARAGSAWRRTACRSTPTSRTSTTRRRDRRHGAGRRRATSQLGDARRCAAGEVAVVTLAAGVGSRWTQGAGVVKALQPVRQLGGRHRTLPRNPPGQEPPATGELGGTPSRTSSPPAT